MFYSHTFLGRKGPLGTVWCAAHLQSRLKRSHYTATDISSTVDRIMFPEVPIALRMSGHLLLGVVRIYSKKVDYLYQDCNIVLIGIRKAFVSSEVNLPEDATHAPFLSITLPDTFELDALDLGDDLFKDGFEDNHLRSQEEITLKGQVPFERDPYVAISFDEDIMLDSSCPDDVPDSGVRPMDEDILPPVENIGVFQDPSPSKQTEVPVERCNEDNSPQSFPEIEVMRDAIHDYGLESLPVCPDNGNGITESGRYSDHVMNEKEIPSPVVESMEFTLAPGDQTVLSQQRPEPSSVATEEAPEIFDSHISFGHISAELAIRLTPPAERPKAVSRKRKQLYDEFTVLTNKVMENALKDSSGLLRKRKMRPSTTLGVWKFNNNSRKENILLEPSITGCCPDIHNVFKKDFLSSKPHLTLLEDVQEHRADSPPPVTRDAHSPSAMPEIDMEIERLRHHEGYSGINILHDFIPSAHGDRPSPSKENDFTPVSTSNLESQSEPRVGTTVGSGALPVPDIEMSTGPPSPEWETPVTSLEEQIGVEDTGLSDIPELMNSAEDLHFLEADSNTPAGSQKTQQVDTLSVRTRAVAQYLKRHSPGSQISEELYLSLDKILEGKKRKLCARMFFETLVLKSYGLIDVQQEEPYGDITLKLTPTLSKAQF